MSSSNRVYNDDYATCRFAAASLRMSVPGVTPAAISTWLDLEPADRVATGFVDGRGQLWSSPRDGFAFSSSDFVTSRDPRRHLDWLLARLETRRAALDDLRAQDGALAQIWCRFESAFGDGGPMFWPEQLKAIGALDLELAVDGDFGVRPVSEPPSGDYARRLGHGYVTPRSVEYRTCERADVRLIVYHIHPDQVTACLAVEPSRVSILGTPITNRIGRTRIPDRHVWELTSRGQIPSLDLRDHVDWLASRVLQSAESLAKLVRATDSADAIVWGSWESSTGHGGPALWPSQLAAIAGLGREFRLNLSFYGPD